jgi:dTMP kinase
MIQHQYSGNLIVICGTDGVGKSTLISNLADKLRNLNHDVVLTRQPTTALRESQLFRDYIYKPESRDIICYQALLSMMLSDRLQHQKSVIEPELKAGKFVISDRYIFTMISTMRARGFDEKWLHEAINTHIIKPDYAFLLTAPLEVVTSRIKDRNTFEESYIEIEHLIASQKEFLNCAVEYNINVIDTAIEDIANTTAKALKVIQK